MNDLDVKTVTLHMEQYIAAQLVNWPYANPPRVGADYRIEHCALLMQMIQDVIVQRELLAEYPRTWWDAVKLRWFPEWALRWRPVQTRRIDGEILYPMIAIPRYRDRVTFKLIDYPFDPECPKTYTKDLA